MPNTKVITYWQPNANLEDESNENQERIVNQLIELIIKFGYVNYVMQSIHTPTAMAKWNPSSDWHGEGEYPFIVWSNIQPTDFLFNTGIMLEARNGAVILIDGIEGKHRTPPNIHPKRWLVRLDP